MPGTLKGGNIVLRRARDKKSVAIGITEKGGGKTITIKPSAMLEGNTRYELVFNGGVRDVMDTPMAGYSEQLTRRGRWRIRC
jgi:hypothetical protein